MLTLGFHELVLAIVHDPANGRVGRGGNLHEIQAFTFSDPDSFIGSHDPQLGAVFVDDPDFGSPNAIVDTRLIGSNTTLPIYTRKKSLPSFHKKAKAIIGFYA